MVETKFIKHPGVKTVINYPKLLLQHCLHDASYQLIIHCYCPHADKCSKVLRISYLLLLKIENGLIISLEVQKYRLSAVVHSEMTSAKIVK